jgi:BON domain
MNFITRVAAIPIIIAVLLSTALPCGPGYVTPIFITTAAPENPYANFAAGRLGIISPGYRRSLLIAAYRYLNGSGFTPDEQKALVELWKSDIDRNYTRTDDIAPVIRAWVEKRKDVVGTDEKTPEIYAERSYGGYDFFPNCTQNAFETATATLADRASAHGPSDAAVRDWLNAQDAVFANCSTGKRIPAEAPPGSPDWLQRDREYQKAAAEFYALDYADAKRRFAEIAQDSESPWRDTADYLVARTLIRQASLARSGPAAEPLYQEAEQRLGKFTTGNGPFAASAKRMDGLIQYRLHPKDRVGELARILANQSGNDNFKQDVIDYTWLLDKFENEALVAEANRKAIEEKRKNDPTAPTIVPDNVLKQQIDAEMAKLNANVDVTVADGEVTLTGRVAKSSLADIIRAASQTKPKKVTNELTVVESAAEADKSKLEITLYSEDYTKNWVIHVDADASDDDAAAEMERAMGRPLTDDIKKRVAELRQSAYVERFSKARQPEYEGGYVDAESPLTPAIIPDFLKSGELSNWLFVFQMKGPEAYAYSAKRYNDTNSEIWLLTALCQADRTSAGLKNLLEAAQSANRTSPGYLTICYHAARLYLELGKEAEARQLIQPMLDAGDDIPLSVRNQFVALRLHLAQTLEDYLAYSLRKPFAFDFGGSAGSVDELIAAQKADYDPEYNKDGREAFDREIEENFKDERLWQSRFMFDTGSINMMNSHFSQAVLIQAEQSPALPDYFRPRFAVAIWTRAYLLDDWTTLSKMTAEVAKYQPEFADQLKVISDAKTPAARETAALYFVLKNPYFSPYLEDGMGKTDNERGDWDSNDWWCSSYLADAENSDGGEHKEVAAPPSFLTPAQKQAATVEYKKIIALGDAPQYLADRVLAWAKLAPADPRVPESLYIVHQANGWTKYGCGNNEELQKKIGDLMNTRYPQSEWTRKLAEDASEK